MSRFFVMISLFFTCLGFGQGSETTEKQNIREAKRLAKKFSKKANIDVTNVPKTVLSVKGVNPFSSLPEKKKEKKFQSGNFW